MIKRLLIFFAVSLIGISQQNPSFKGWWVEEKGANVTLRFSPVMAATSDNNLGLQLLCPNLKKELFCTTISDNNGYALLIKRQNSAQPTLLEIKNYIGKILNGSRGEFVFKEISPPVSNPKPMVTKKTGK